MATAPPNTLRIFRLQGFTLIELLIVIAILGILAAAIMVAINPRKRTAQARDAQRKSDVNAIANALITHYTLSGTYPDEALCDTSKGIYASEGPVSSTDCNNTSNINGSYWDTTDPELLIYQQLVTRQQALKRLPIDPINNSKYYYRYEPSSDANRDCDPFPPAPGSCTRYWIGARMESVDNPQEEGRRVFRCSDDASLAAGAGCKEVLFNNPGCDGSNPGCPQGWDSFDRTFDPSELL